MQQIHKYPRTLHIEGSRLQPGDEDLDAVPFDHLSGQHLVVEEKVDGANCAISFREGLLHLQSRGHYLTGGGREKHFDLLKQWATTHASAFQECLGNRYVMYGEWLYAKHTVFYDALPHYFMEFDILDTESRQFLSTPGRQKLTANLPITSVRVLHKGTLQQVNQLVSLLGPSAFIRKGHIERLRAISEDQGLDFDRVYRETDRSEDMEGLYVKVENDEAVLARYKYVRASFLAAVNAAAGHWLNRPIIPNQLLDHVDLFQT